MTDILVSDFILVLLIFVRILAAFTAAPIFGHSAIPSLSKIFIAFVIAYIVFMSVDTTNVLIEFNIWWISINVIKEVIVGVITGFCLNLVFYGINFAGSIISYEVGLAMANVMNPMDETSGNVLGEIIYFLALMVFFLINGHHYVIQGLAYTFKVVPLGSVPIKESVVDLMIKYSGAIFVIAIKISAPILVSYFLIHIGEGILSRVIPQMQVFFVTQPLKIGLGFFLLMIVTPVYVYTIKSLLQDFEAKMFTLIRAMGS